MLHSMRQNVKASLDISKESHQIVPLTTTNLRGENLRNTPDFIGNIAPQLWTRDLIAGESLVDVNEDAGVARLI